jgi:predicted double-glycine peptidase
MQNFNMTATQDQLANLAGTGKKGTRMYGIYQAATEEGLIAEGMSINATQLVPGNIVYLTMTGGNGHFSVITSINGTTVGLADPDLGNINMNITNFTAIYSGYALAVAIAVQIFMRIFIIQLISF